MRPTTRFFAVRALCAALVICLGALSQVSAQTAPGPAHDFSGLDRARNVAVVDDAGTEVTGRLLRFTPESLTMKVDGRERVFERRTVATVHGIGDPLKNGMLVGLGAGAAYGIAAGAIGTTCGGFFTEERTCTPTEKAQLGAVGGVLFGAVGLGVGALVDRLISRRTLLYARTPPSGSPTVSLAPVVTVSGARLRLTATW